MIDSALAWAITHEPTREAYRLSTGEDVGPSLDRYIAWLEENILGPIGAAEDLGGGALHSRNPPGTGPVVARRISSPQA
ncbi:hypothetical protein GOD74_13240 [Sinorhizobium medicae]|nr:hypothetical protein [Sinorhizobium medicae]